jgi:predicted nucleic-acid-binding protein
VKITADTNVLVRAVVRDDATQARSAERAMKAASSIAVALPTLCEFVWVLRKVYGLSPDDIGAALRVLLDSRNVVADRAAAQAGLELLEDGGDFADGVIAHEGERLGADVFVSFDKSAAALLANRGHRVSVLNG